MEISTLLIYLTLSNIIFCIMKIVLLIFAKIYYNKINIICVSFVLICVSAYQVNSWNHKEESLSRYRGL